jgi:hypothetical protein
MTPNFEYELSRWKTGNIEQANKFNWIYVMLLINVLSINTFFLHNFIHIEECLFVSRYLFEDLLIDFINITIVGSKSYAQKNIQMVGCSIDYLYI